jgi:hypothetical protein
VGEHPQLYGLKVEGRIALVASNLHAMIIPVYCLLAEEYMFYLPLSLIHCLSLTLVQQSALSVGVALSSRTCAD